MRQLLPRGAMILLTSRCQLKCKHCGAIHADDYHVTDLDPAFVKKALVDLRNGNTCIVAFSGGDPILYPDLIEVLRYTRELGMLPVLGITGVDVSDEMIVELKNVHIGCVQVSLDGSTAEINDSIRGYGNYAEVLQTIERFTRAGVNVNVAVCVFKENIHDLVSMLVLLKQMQVYKVKIQFWRPVNGLELHALSQDEENHVIQLCKEFEMSNSLNSWIEIPNSNLRKIHSSSIVICANGNICDTRGVVFI